MTTSQRALLDECWDRLGCPASMHLGSCPAFGQISSHTPVLPYGPDDAPSSGFAAGVATSQERAERLDSDGTTAARQAEVLRLLCWVTHRTDWGSPSNRGREYGLTWQEVARLTGWHHGQTSAALSTLHKAKQIARLTEKRGGCFVYVLPEYVNGRATQAQGRPTPQPSAQVAVDLARAEAAIARVRALHHRGGMADAYCVRCAASFPCSTVRALDGEDTTP